MKRPRRKAIPWIVKDTVWFRQLGACAECGKPLAYSPVEHDHRPALILRPVNAAGSDYEPPQNDPEFIDALHPRCHLQRTVGRKADAEKTVTTKGSDAWVAKKFRRLENPKKRPKAKIAKRPNPWQKRKFR